MQLTLCHWVTPLHPQHCSRPTAAWPLLRCQATRVQGLQSCSKFSEDVLRPVALALAALARKAPTNTLGSVYKKYIQTRFQEVAKTPDLEELLQERMVA